MINLVSVDSDDYVRAIWGVGLEGWSAIATFFAGLIALGIGLDSARRARKLEKIAQKDQIASSSPLITSFSPWVKREKEERTNAETQERVMRHRLELRVVNASQNPALLLNDSRAWSPSGDRIGVWFDESVIQPQGEIIIKPWRDGREFHDDVVYLELHYCNPAGGSQWKTTFELENLDTNKYMVHNEFHNGPGGAEFKSRRENSHDN